ncbi:MAG: hypothetical protein ACKOEM_13375, partial [Planctomycetia bacterium]
MAKRHPRLSPPKIKTAPRLSQFEKQELKNLQNELRERKIEALKLYRPNPNQEEIHKCRASEVLVIGGNRSGKSLCTFVEDARAVTGQDPFGKYPKENGVLVVIGKDWKHLGLVCFPMLMKPGAFKIIKDANGEWRAFDPVLDAERRSEARPAPPLIPQRLVKKISWLLKSAGYCQKITLTTGWEIHFFSSESEPVQGYQADRIHCDEDLNDERWIPESLARIVDRRGKFQWSAMPHSTNNALLGMKERAEASEAALGEKSAIRLF